MAGTLAEARAPLGLATQRPGNARALARTTPALLRRYTVITLTAPRLIEPGATCVCWPAGSRNTRPPCADAIALVRRQLWEQIHGSPSLQDTDMLHMPRALFARFVETVCYAA